MNNFDMAFSYTVENEGRAFVDDPNDSGGATKFGITKKVFDDFYKCISNVNEIKFMTLETAKNIYFENYWTHMKLDQIGSPKIGICLFDTAVLYGPAISGLLAQKTAKMFGAQLVLDGCIGSGTISALNEIKSEDDFVMTFHGFILERIDSVIASNPKNEVFRKGWTKRADRLLTLKTNVPEMDS